MNGLNREELIMALQTREMELIHELNPTEQARCVHELPNYEAYAWYRKMGARTQEAYLRAIFDLQPMFPRQVDPHGETAAPAVQWEQADMQTGYGAPMGVNPGMQAGYDTPMGTAPDMQMAYGAPMGANPSSAQAYDDLNYGMEDAFYGEASGLYSETGRQEMPPVRERTGARVPQFVNVAGRAAPALLEVPADVMALYHKLCPTAKRSDVQKHYTRSKR